MYSVPLFLSVLSFCSGVAVHQDLHSFPTRRSSDLVEEAMAAAAAVGDDRLQRRSRGYVDRRCPPRRDRKSTRLNSSHLGISYAVFCLKKKKKSVIIRHHDYDYSIQSVKLLP